MEREAILLLDEFILRDRAEAVVAELAGAVKDMHEFVHIFRLVRKWGELGILGEGGDPPRLIAAAKRYLDGFGLENIRAGYVRMLIHAIVGQDSETDAMTALEYAETVERTCFEHVVHICKTTDGEITRHWISKEFENIYRMRCGVLLSNLDANSETGAKYGKELLRNIYAGKNVGAMTERELAPAASAVERAALEVRLGQKVVEKTSEMYTCPFCGHKKSTYEERQLRSADEASDIICTCMQCKNRFRA